MLCRSIANPKLLTLSANHDFVSTPIQEWKTSGQKKKKERKIKNKPTTTATHVNYRIS